jgi:hypothetical protein
MPNSAARATPRADLAQALAEYDFSKKKYIGFKVFPSLLVPRETATFSVLLREGLLRREDVKRAARSAYDRGLFEVADDSYRCQEYGHEILLDDSERAKYARDFDAEFWSSTLAYERVLREHEIRVAGLVFDPATWTGASLTTAVGTEWSSPATADVLGDVQHAKDQIQALTGMKANTLIVSQKVANFIRMNVVLIDSITYVEIPTDAAVRAAMAEWLGLEQVLVGSGVYNSSPEGETACAVADIWDDEYAMVCVAGRNNDPLQTPCLGRTVTWEADSPETDGLIAEEYREDLTRSWVYRARHNVDEKLFASHFGHLLSNITA